MFRPLGALIESAREAAVRLVLSRRGAARTVNGIALRVDPVGRHTFTPIYDAGATAYLRQHLAEGMQAWTVGANVGVYTLQLAHWVGSTGHVVAFEPNPAARAVLTRNVALNGLPGRVEIVPSRWVARRATSPSSPPVRTAWAAPAAPTRGSRTPVGSTCR